MPSTVNDPWDGPSKIIIGIDLGTTCSAVSYSYLYKGGSKLVTSVSKWPGQEKQAGDTKIPTVMWYDEYQKPVKYGASALGVDVAEAQEDGWQLAKHFKLNLHPETMRSRHQLKTSDLPHGIPLNQIYSDYMAYLLQHTREFFEERVLDGATVWKHYFSSADVTIAHPNGWGIREQVFLRKAAIAAGFPDPEKTNARIRFVTEAEASVLFCISKAELGSNWLEKGAQFAVCDAGGSTVDITTYQVTRTHPSLQLQETNASTCIQAGGIFVDDAAKGHLRLALSDPGWVAYAKFDDEDVEDSIRRGLTNFEAEKKSFGTISELKLEVARSRFRYEKSHLRIRRGELMLAQNIVSSFFNPCTDEIVAAVKKQIAGLNVKNVLLVGGFGESPYLRQKLIREMANHNCRITIANDLTSKAVADGAVSWSMQASVDGRATRFSYGTDISLVYDPDDPEHKGRIPRPDVDGKDWVRYAWDELLPRGRVVKTNDKVTDDYYKIYSTNTPFLGTYTTTLYAFTPADRAAPRFMCNPTATLNNLREGFVPVCTLSANLSGMAGGLQKIWGPRGVYWKLAFNISVEFGGVELQAHIHWVENGSPKRGEVSVIPN